jgi:hypothetical protein
VTAAGGFDPDSWASTGIGYAVEIDSAAPPDEVARLLAVVDEVAGPACRGLGAPDFPRPGALGFQLTPHRDLRRIDE